MPGETTEHRKLAAIMFTDMVGYSALAQQNEALALELLEEHRGLLRPLFPSFNGTEIKTIGDAFLVEFESALEATQCAIEIQRALAKHNSDVPAERRIQVRIGIHIGDVVHRGGDVYGDGVNIASRIEPMAGPGGICVSVDVERQIRHNIEVGLTKLGPAELKNIQTPMELFRIVLPWEKAPAGPVPPAAVGRRTLSGVGWTAFSPRWRQVALALGVVLLVAGAAWWVLSPRGLSPASRTAKGIISLAVKPLDDFSGDTNQAYLSDGMTDLLCAALGNISALRVPGRSSVMRYKGGRKSIREMARELSVDAIVEGSVQRASNHVLITAQLVDARTDRHLWSTNYERDLGDFFKVQSEVAQAIAAEIQVRLTPEDQARLARVRPVNRDAVEACLLGMHHLWQWSEEGSTNALQHFRKAIGIDPTYAPAHAGLAQTYAWGASGLWAPREAMPKAKAAAQTAIQLDPMFADSYVARGIVQWLFDWDWAAAEGDFKHALELNPHSSAALDAYSWFLATRGRHEEARGVLNRGLALDPLSPTLNWDVATSYWYAGDPERAVPHLRKALEVDHNFLEAHVDLGWCYLATKRPAEALTEFQTAAQLAPDAPSTQWCLGFAYATMGRRAEATNVLARLGTMATKRYVTRLAQALVYLGLGDKDAALDWLEQAYDQRDGEMPYLRVDPVLAALRNEPRFQALVAKVGLDK